MKIAWLVVPLLALALAGCSDSPRPSPADREPPTFNKDVAPILFEHCAPCHRPGQAAPFTLLSYADAQSRADKIAHATLTRQMPPWLPARRRAGVCRRTSSAATIRSTRFSAGSRAAPSKATPAISRSHRSGRRVGRSASRTWCWPSVAPTCCRPAQEDVYRNLVLPVSIPATRFVRAVEFLPGDAPVHHAVVHLDRTSGSRRRDGADGHPGFDGMGGPGTQDPDGHFVGWAPGRGPIVAPPAMPWRLEAGTDLVLELHLLPGKTPVAVRPTVALFFTDQPPAAVPAMLKMGSQAIDIPAGQRDYAITDTYVLPVDADLLSVYPHAHFLGKEMHVRAVLPDGTDRRLLHIPRWSFHWQQDYRYRAASVSAARHDGDDAIHVRQLGQQRGESASSARARDGRTALDGRDGEPAAAIGAALGRRPRDPDGVVRQA